MRVMTFNVLCAGRGENHWCRRQSAVCGIIKDCAPDFFGIQEAHFGWMRCISGRLSDNYAYVGIGKDDGRNKGEFSPVFYNKHLYDVVERLDFWLSESPDEPSLGWDGAENRTCSGALFRNKKTNEEIAVFNTHLDHIGREAQVNGANLILEKLKKYGKIKTVLMGDFNVTPDSDIYSLFVDGGFTDSRSIAEKRDEVNSFHAFGGTSKMIDFIFEKNINSVSSVKTVTDLADGRYPSDHYPVVADFE